MINKIHKWLAQRLLPSHGFPKAKLLDSGYTPRERCQSFGSWWSFDANLPGPDMTMDRRYFYRRFGYYREYYMYDAYDKTGLE